MPTVTTPDGVNHVFPEEATQAQMLDALNVAAPAEATQGRPHNMDWREAGKTAGQFLTGSLPTAGGMVGDFLGGLGGTALEPGGGTVAGMGVGGAVGGGLGEGARQLITRGKLDWPGIQRQAGVQGLSALAGAGVGAGLNVAGKGLMRAAVRPSKAALAEAPNLIGDIIDKRLTPGNFLGGGSQVAAAGRSASGAKLTGLLDAMQGWTRTAADFQKPMEDWIATEVKGKSPLWANHADKFNELMDRFIKTNPGDLTPQAVQDLKQGAQSEAQRIYRQEAMAAKGLAAPPAESERLTAQFNKQIASVLRQHLESIPGVAERNAITKKWIQATSALSQAESHGLPMAAHIATGAAGLGAGTMVGAHLPEHLLAGLGAMAAARVATHPAFLGRAALAATDPFAQFLARQAPRVAGSMLFAPRDSTQK